MLTDIAIEKAFLVGQKLAKFTGAALQRALTRANADVQLALDKQSFLTNRIKKMLASEDASKGYQEPPTSWPTGIGALKAANPIKGARASKLFKDYKGNERTLLTKRRWRDQIQNEVSRRGRARPPPRRAAPPPPRRWAAPDPRRRQQELYQQERRRFDQQRRQEQQRRDEEKKKKRGRLRRFFSRASFDRGPYVAYAASVLRSLEANTQVSDPNTEELAREVDLDSFNRLLQRYIEAVDSYWQSASDPSAPDYTRLARERKVEQLRRPLEFSEEHTALLKRNLLRAVDRWAQLRYWSKTPAQRYDANREILDVSFLAAVLAGRLDSEE